MKRQLKKTKKWWNESHKKVIDIHDESGNLYSLMYIANYCHVFFLPSLNIWQPNTIRPRWVGYMSTKLLIFFMNVIKIMPLHNVNLVNYSS